MTAILSDPDLAGALPASGRASDDIQREMLSLRARVRARNPSRPASASVAHADLTPGAARALRTFEQHRDMVRSCFRTLKRRVQTELADLSLEMASETAARLCLRFGRQGQEWLWWRLSRIVDQFVAVSKPAGLPASLELLATRSVLSGLERYRNR